MMWSQRASGFFVAAQFTARCYITVLGLCISVSCFVPGDLVAVAQVTDSPVASIESLVRSEQYDKALQLTRSQLQSKPNDVRLWTLEGIIYSLKGEKTEAIGSFDKALRLSPTYIPALKGEVQLLYESGDKRAIPQLNRILKADPNDLTAQEMLAMLQKKQGDCQSANEHFAVSWGQIGTHPETLEAYGYCLVQAKEFQKAVPVFQELADLLPDRIYPKYDLAVVLIATNQNGLAPISETNG